MWAAGWVLQPALFDLQVNAGLPQLVKALEQLFFWLFWAR
jgi:hypothetical protein